MSMFEVATRNKVRFESNKGSLTVEDVWDLPLTSAKGVSLDDLAKDLNRQIKDYADESFVTKNFESDELKTKKLAFEIVKHVISVKLAEAENRKLRAERKERKEKLLQAIAAKQDESLQQASLEDLQKMVEELG